MTYEELLEVYMAMSHDDLARQLALKSYLERSETAPLNTPIPGINIPSYPYTPSYPYNPYWPNQIWYSTNTTNSTEHINRPTFGPRDKDC